MAHHEEMSDIKDDVEGSNPSVVSTFASYETLPVAVVIWDQAERVVYLNPPARDLLGSSVEDERLRSANELLRCEADDSPPEGLAPPTLWARLSGRMILTRSDGEPRFIEARSVTIQPPTGPAPWVLTTLIDRTSAAGIEKSLNAERDLLQTVMDIMPDLIYMKDRESRFTRVNKAHAMNGGFSDPTELIGKTDFDIYPREFAQMIFDEEQLGMSARQPIMRRVEDQTARFGRPLWIQSTKMPIIQGGAVVGLVGISRDITELQLVQERLSHQALHDTLTGLPNRALLLDRLEQTVLTSHRERSTFTLCLLDLDRFKEVNDTLGHQRGDRLLQEVATRIHGVLRESDTVARLGGDEFAIILPGITEEGAVSVALRIRHALEQPLDLDGHHPDLAASIGIAGFPLHADDAATLLIFADVAMYVAKGAGSGYAVYDPDLDRHSPDHLALPQEFRHALAHEELFLEYQPLVELKGGNAVTVEALLRWNHPRHGPISPTRIIPLAERIGALDALTLWVLRTALAQCRAWHEGGLPLRVAMNLSATTLQDGDLPEKVRAALAHEGVAAADLTLEITEEALMTNSAQALVVLTTLADMGVKLAIDDFGTGFSSLAYLKHLPVHTLKIDKSFVLGMAPDHQDDAIVRSVIELSHNLGLAVVAEGIEDLATMERLAALTCDTGQGFFMSKPMSAADVEEWMRTSAWGSVGNRDMET